MMAFSSVEYSSARQNRDKIAASVSTWEDEVPCPSRDCLNFLLAAWKHAG